MPGDNKIQLDTNFLINALNPKSAEAHLLRVWIEAGVELSLSIMAWSEFLCGPVDNEDIVEWGKIISVIYPTTQSQGELAAQLFNKTGRRSRSLPDCLIAACAMEKECRLATSNKKDFIHFLDFGLKLAE